MVYAFDGNDALLDAVRAVNQGSSYADLVQDMSDLQGIGEANREPLEAIGFDFALIERAGELKTILGDLLAKVSADKLEKSPEKDIRDRVFTIMDTAVDKIRKCGRSVFWKDSSRASAYASAYMRKQRRKQQRAKEKAKTSTGGQS